MMRRSWSRSHPFCLLPMPHCTVIHLYDAQILVKVPSILPAAHASLQRHPFVGCADPGQGPIHFACCPCMPHCNVIHLYDAQILVEVPSILPAAHASLQRHPFV